MTLGVLGGLCPAQPIGGLDFLGCFIAAWELPILGVVFIGALAGAWFLIGSREPEETSASPFLVFPLEGNSRAAGERPRPTRRGAHERPTPGPGSVRRPPPRAPAAGSATERMSLGPELRRSMEGPPAPDLDVAVAGGAPSPGDNHRGTVSYERPPDGTLQLLPGRLEIRNGPGKGEEIRFVRIPGAEQEVTFGRSEGPRYRHVQLRSPTVSREHARLCFRDGAWTLRNESSTNPTVHNGRPLTSGLEEVDLHNGDRIEMGEISFVFHQAEVRDRLPFRSSWYTDRGRRSVNQDAVVVRTLPDGRELAVVCDGMGSHAQGGVASHVALEALMASLTEGVGLAAAVREANRAVYRAGEEEAEREGMGTTLVALLREGDRYQIANVGDSRAYRVDASGIRQLTHDHSFVAEAIREGQMSVEEASRSPWKNAVTRNLGAEPDVEVDMFGGFDATEPHLVLLCTDGVHGILDSEEIHGLIARTPDVRDLARALGERALMNGGEDNVAVAAMKFGGPPGSTEAGG